MNSVFSTLLPQTEDDLSASTQREAAANRASWPTAWTTLIASASRTATTVSAGIPTLGYRGVLVMLSNTTTDATLNLTLGINLPSALGTNIGLANGVAFGVSFAGDRGFLVSPETNERDSVGIAGINFATDIRRNRLPDLFRVVVFHSNANPITYQVRYLLIP